MATMKAVIRGSHSEGNIKILFKGTYDECIGYMRTHSRWTDLISLNDDGTPGKYMSWIL